MTQHNDDLKRVSKKFDIPFIDLNQPELYYMDDWLLFADEDHLETCKGVILLQTAIDEGYRRFHDQVQLLPTIKRSEIESTSQYLKSLPLCGKMNNVLSNKI